MPRLRRLVFCSAKVGAGWCAWDERAGGGWV